MSNITIIRIRKTMTKKGQGLFLSPSKNPNETKLPKKYNRKSTSKNKPTFDHIYHHFFSALANSNAKTKQQATTTAAAVVLRSDLYSTISSWIEKGEGYLKYYDNSKR